MAAPQTIIYKVVDSVEIALDLYLPTTAKSVPVLLWFHGGGLLQGSRTGVAPHLKRSVEKYGHAVISADYRLAPQVGIEQIWEDVNDCINFIRSASGLAKHIGADSVDASRLAVSGSSAGGYLAFLAGLYAEPKPSVILPIYPITDPLGYFFTNSQPFPLLKPPGQVDRSRKVSASDLASYLDKDAKAVSGCPRGSSRSDFYFYMMDNANLAELLHFAALDGPDRFAANERWRIAKSIEANGLPPTYVVHGNLDRAVGVEQADEVIGVMAGLGLTFRYDRLKNADHLFDQVSEVELTALYEFMHKHLGGSKL